MVESESEPSSQDEESEDRSEEEEQPIRRNNNQRWNQEPRDDSKVEIPEFDGKTQGDELLEWILIVECVFDLKDYAEEKKVKLVAAKLKGYAPYGGRTLSWIESVWERRKSDLGAR